ncbi:MAG: aminoacyl-tRNA hydrolase [Streptosporangiales bacterium]|nr:aminoacyl-tRNA hydrolase [Streptosporangiales bacterium]
MAEDPWLVVGLGNPGLQYAGNRHNAGFMVVDLLAERLSVRFRSHRGRADVAETHLVGGRVVLAKPRSYMNESGGPVAAVRGFFKAPIDHTVVVHDELDLPLGTVRLKQGGGAGGHRGVDSVTKALGSQDYFRVRFGIGRPPGRMDPAHYVLRDFSTAERKELALHVERAADAVEVLIRDGLAVAQNTYHAL